MNLDEAIHEFVRLDARRAELKQEVANVLAVLLPEASAIRNGQNTVRLQSNDGKVIRVQFKEAYNCDANQLNSAKEMIGDDFFESLFKIEYLPRLRELKKFLASKSTDERIETAKEIIKEGIHSHERSPYIEIEKG